MNRTPETIRCESALENMKPFIRVSVLTLIIVILMERRSWEGPGFLSRSTMILLVLNLLITAWVYLPRLRMTADLASRRIELRWSFLGLGLPARYVDFDDVKTIYVGCSNPMGNVGHDLAKRRCVVPVELRLVEDRSETIFQTREPTAAETLSHSLSRLLGVEIIHAETEQAELQSRIAGFVVPHELRSHLTQEGDELVVAVPPRIIERRSVLAGLGIWLCSPLILMIAVSCLRTARVEFATSTQNMTIGIVA